MGVLSGVFGFGPMSTYKPDGTVLSGTLLSGFRGLGASVAEVGHLIFRL